MEKVAALLRTAAGASARRFHAPGSRGGDGSPGAETAAPSDDAGRAAASSALLCSGAAPQSSERCAGRPPGLLGSMKNRAPQERAPFGCRLPPRRCPERCLVPRFRSAPPLRCVLQGSPPPTLRLAERVCCRSRALHPQAPPGQRFRSAGQELRGSGSERGDARREAGGGAGSRLQPESLGRRGA